MRDAMIPYLRPPDLVYGEKQAIDFQSGSQSLCVWMKNWQEAALWVLAECLLPRREAASTLLLHAAMSEAPQ
jgi:hypothetical protein